MINLKSLDCHGASLCERYAERCSDRIPDSVIGHKLNYTACRSAECGNTMARTDLVGGCSDRVCVTASINDHYRLSVINPSRWSCQCGCINAVVIQRDVTRKGQHICRTSEGGKCSIAGSSEQFVRCILVITSGSCDCRLTGYC